MSISSVSSAAASMASPNTVSGQAALLTFRKALDIEASNALQLLQALPQVAPVAQPGQTVGANVDTYA